ncbi:MAG: hypothetical protein COB14_04275 [Alphaproteobacteria bacterium]|nr:MAG: hypothetical protein COB14_04275 [Alphaproteobacteria bacterium]
MKSDEWIDNEIDRKSFRDKRLGDRLRLILGQLSGSIGKPIPMACQDCANTKAAYRFLSNDTVS